MKFSDSTPLPSYLSQEIIFNNLIHILYLFYSTYILPKLQAKYSRVESYTGLKSHLVNVTLKSH